MKVTYKYPNICIGWKIRCPRRKYLFIEGKYSHTSAGFSNKKDQITLVIGRKIDRISSFLLGIASNSWYKWYNGAHH